MALIRKTSPVALDKEIDLFQDYLFTKLGFSDWESLHRVYLNPMRAGRIPEAFETDGEYREVFYNDSFTLSSFFLASERREILDEGITETDVSLIFSVDLVKLFLSITDHRADEEFNNDVQFASEAYGSTDTFRLEGIEMGIDNVYSEFNKDQIKFDDMSNQYVVRFNYKVQYTPECCTNC